MFSYFIDPRVTGQVVSCMLLLHLAALRVRYACHVPLYNVSFAHERSVPAANTDLVCSMAYSARHQRQCTA